MKTHVRLRSTKTDFYCSEKNMYIYLFSSNDIYKNNPCSVFDIAVENKINAFALQNNKTNSPNTPEVLIAVIIKLNDKLNNVCVIMNFMRTVVVIFRSC